MDLARRPRDGVCDGGLAPCVKCPRKTAVGPKCPRRSTYDFGQIGLGASEAGGEREAQLENVPAKSSPAGTCWGHFGDTTWQLARRLGRNGRQCGRPGVRCIRKCDLRNCASDSGGLGADYRSHALLPSDLRTLQWEAKQDHSDLGPHTKYCYLQNCHHSARSDPAASVAAPMACISAERISVRYLSRLSPLAEMILIKFSTARLVTGEIVFS